MFEGRDKETGRSLLLTMLLGKKEAQFSGKGGIRCKRGIKARWGGCGTWHLDPTDPSIRWSYHLLIVPHSSPVLASFRACLKSVVSHWNHCLSPLHCPFGFWTITLIQYHSLPHPALDPFCTHTSLCDTVILCTIKNVLTLSTDQYTKSVDDVHSSWCPVS